MVGSSLNLSVAHIRVWQGVGSILFAAKVCMASMSRWATAMAVTTEPRAVWLPCGAPTNGHFHSGHSPLQVILRTSVRHTEAD